MTDEDIKLVDNVITIEVTNKNEQSTLNRLGKKWLKKLTSLGVENLSLDIIVNEEKSKEIKQIIAAEKEAISVKVKVNAPKSELIWGKNFRGKPITLDSILGPEFNIIAEVYVLNIEIISTSSDLKIITLMISDKTDSMYGKMFIRNTDELDVIEKNINKGDWIKIRGNVKDDNYTKDLVINITDIMSIPSKEVLIKDEAAEKRVELHAHTFMSQMDGLIDVKDLIKTAKRYGHKAVIIAAYNRFQKHINQLME